MGLHIHRRVLCVTLPCRDSLCALPEFHLSTVVTAQMLLSKGLLFPVIIIIVTVIVFGAHPMMRVRDKGFMFVVTFNAYHNPMSQVDYYPKFNRQANIEKLIHLPKDM